MRAEESGMHTSLEKVPRQNGAPEKINPLRRRESGRTTGPGFKPTLSFQRREQGGCHKPLSTQKGMPVT